jgi:hypothetical protein
MDNIEKCFATLNVLIAEPGPAGIPPAEKAVDHLLDTAPTDRRKADLLLKVEKKLFEIAKNGSRKQSDFIKLVNDFCDFRMREVRARLNDDAPTS